jgi:thiamine biosynthesis protein ThiI
MMAKRGMRIDCLHFHSYPYTNLQAKEKVVDLARILSEYTCGTNVYTVSVTHIQEAIHEKCKPQLMITLLRRFMFRIAERHAKRCGAQCLITGESLGQVASQTIEGMTSSNSVVEKLPVLRPLVGFDKNEIIERSVKIGTYETSILPYEDCCTVFLPDFPAIRPKLKDILAEERKLDVEGLIKTAFESIEKIEL